MSLYVHAYECFLEALPRTLQQIESKLKNVRFFHITLTENRIALQLRVDCHCNNTRQMTYFVTLQSHRNSRTSSVVTDLFEKQVSSLFVITLAMIYSTPCLNHVLKSCAVAIVRHNIHNCLCFNVETSKLCDTTVSQSSYHRNTYSFVI